MTKKETDTSTRRVGIGGVRRLYQGGTERRLASLAPSTAKQGGNNRREQDPERPKQQKRTKN